MPLSERNKVLIFLAPLVLAFAILLLPNSRDETWWPTEVAESLDYPNDSFPDGTYVHFESIEGLVANV